ncbi:unnamed protein product [Cuscuta europaea]|uniref:Uncharacterized protein n=1 Tax=Cuscuta europaea TaxID=41803 RepID=A0A9P0ZJ44_CUSEU|nr:unnamed protein product [Cuscuta europaea]
MSFPWESTPRRTSSTFPHPLTWTSVKASSGMEDIAEQYNNMAIGGDEGEIILDEETAGEEEGSVRSANFPVVSTLLTDKMVKFNVFRDLMASIWRPGKGISIKEIGEKRLHLLSHC